MLMMDDIVRQFRSGLTGPTSDTFSGFIGNLKALFSETVLRQEEVSDIVESGGQLHRYKMDSEKEWIRRFGLAVIPRRHLQPDCGGEGVAPVDVRCGMVAPPMTFDASRRR